MAVSTIQYTNGFRRWFLGGATDSSVAESKILFLCDNDGEEAAVGHSDRDAC